ncbi:ABC transporter substrate-binding protein [Tissierella sp. MB52-C2]|uniref:ABC transporter substrate-binding protein n=1 Tax=Tissierella sp. MB52-C2 TaxID=3070999 RepID=UPI00280B3D92|nr:ABC transporter substrate-binding protein [Tissierella sp. MB52-C2]WMM24881.1 ABC transporter substrate-binding protein [Tissierella sp. MB52-C2]
MNKYFDIKDKVYDITEKYPETIDIFVANGFEQLANEKMRKLMGKTISLEMACMTKKVNVELFTQKLVDAIEQNRVSVDSALSMSKGQNGGDIKIEGVLPCPVRVPLLEGFNAWMDENKDKFGFKVDYELKSANLGVDWIKEKIHSDKEDSLSDLFMSAGFDLFFDKELMGKFKSRGVFEDITGLEKLNKDFDNEEIDLKDPQKQYSIIAVVPAVFMVNTDELGDRQMPKSWKDLLKEEFEDSVSLPMKDFDLFNAILLNIYKNYGEEGVTKLGKTLLRSMHPAEMVKAHTKKTESKIPTVTIMPYFFTKMVRSQSPLKPVWPEDGAIISPVFLLTKKETKEQTKSFVDFFFSKEVGEILSTNGKFPSTNPEVDNDLSMEQKFMWLGWDYINNHDIGELIRKCEKIFHDAI